jgi:hypothetical protein
MIDFKLSKLAKISDIEIYRSEPKPCSFQKAQWYQILRKSGYSDMNFCRQAHDPWPITQSKDVCLDQRESPTTGILF